MKRSKRSVRQSPKTSDLELRWQHAFEMLNNLPRLKGANSLSMLGGSFRSAFEVGVVLGKPHQDMIRFLSVSSECYSAVFQIGTNPSMVSIELAGINSIEMQGPIDGSILNVGTWLDGFWTISLSGKDTLLYPLLRFPSSVLRSSSTRGPSAFMDVVEALRAVGLKDKKQITVLKQSVESASSQAKESNFTHRMIPQLNILLAIAEGRSIQELVENAVELHKQYWTSSVDSRFDPHGFISIELCHLIREARKRGLECTCNSEYLPEFLCQLEQG